MAAVPGSVAGGWDPLATGPISLPRTAIRRLQKELQSLAKSPLPGVLAQCDEKDISLLHVLIVGAAETPYADGFFHFILRYPADYPTKPPRVRFMTTDDGTLRIHPNLYANGKVCLSILGTWSGPGWTPSLTTTSVLLSIQSQIMQTGALRCEPGFEKADSARVGHFDRWAEHESARVGVLRQLGEHSTLPKALKEQAAAVFAATGESTARRCIELAREITDGTLFEDPGKWNKGRRFRFGDLGKQLLEAWKGANPSAGGGTPALAADPAAAGASSEDGKLATESGEHKPQPASEPAAAGRSDSSSSDSSDSSSEEDVN